jgi:hypothetical protein
MMTPPFEPPTVGIVRRVIDHVLEHVRIPSIDPDPEPVRPESRGGNLNLDDRSHLSWRHCEREQTNGWFADVNVGSGPGSSLGQVAYPDVESRPHCWARANISHFDLENRSPEFENDSNLVSVKNEHGPKAGFSARLELRELSGVGRLSDFQLTLRTLPG